MTNETYHKCLICQHWNLL